jgi:IPT/TIG domain
MTMLDDRGRIAGRFNAIDAAVAILLLVVVPLAVGAYLLFRTPSPVLASISPATLMEGPGQRIEIDGANFRPFMRVAFGTTPASSFLLGSTKYAIVDVPSLKPGTYDVVLYDYAREIARLSKALTIAPIATDVELEVDGAFKAPSAALAADFKPSITFSAEGQAVARIISVAGPSPADIRLRIGDESVVVPLASRDVAATLLVKCYTVRGTDGAARCVVPTEDRVVVAPDALLTFQTAQGTAVFQIVRARAPRAGNQNQGPLTR